MNRINEPFWRGEGLHKFWGRHGSNYTEVGVFWRVELFVVPLDGGPERRIELAPTPEMISLLARRKAPEFRIFDVGAYRLHRQKTHALARETDSIIRWASLDLPAAPGLLVHAIDTDDPAVSARADAIDAELVRAHDRHRDIAVLPLRLCRQHRAHAGEPPPPAEAVRIRCLNCQMSLAWQVVGEPLRYLATSSGWGAVARIAVWRLEEDTPAECLRHRDSDVRRDAVVNVAPAVLLQHMREIWQSREGHHAEMAQDLVEWMPPSWLPEFASHWHWEVRQWIAHRAPVDAACMIALAADEDWRVRLEVARRVQLDSALGQVLAADDNWLVRRVLV